ncbi:MAG: hypothetical protein Q8M31_19320 [Beijerinckiaceae bacterium]|nr:hypothetical protein [Beijerinckiaceae bacterium]
MTRKTKNPGARDAGAQVDHGYEKVAEGNERLKHKTLAAASALLPDASPYQLHVTDDGTEVYQASCENHHKDWVPSRGVPFMKVNVVGVEDNGVREVTNTYFYAKPRGRGWLMDLAGIYNPYQPSICYSRWTRLRTWPLKSNKEGV